MESYDYIFAGAGCAGLSLVYHLLESELRDSKILLIDPRGKNIPDKTWCYWAEKPLEIHPIEHVHSWKNLSFVSNESKITKNLGDLNYYHLNSHDFFNFIFNKLSKHSNVSIIQDEVSEINETYTSILVKTVSNGQFEGNLLFDSRLKEENINGNDCLKQIFSGWRIKTSTNVFNPESLILMEFPKNNYNQFEFFYILPFSEKEALVEYTTYSQKVIPESSLRAALTEYINSLVGDFNYEITFQESGIIPMSTKMRVKNTSKRFIKIGTAAGWTKASTGYTFHTIQKNCKEIVNYLKQGKIENYQFSRPRRFSFYDNILLNIAQRWPERLQGLFLNLFTTSSTELILRFLNEETRFSEELEILGRLQFPIFIKSLMNYEAH